MNFYPSLPNSANSQAGFGLLEALVALVLLSSVGFALLAWVHQNLDATQRMRSFYSEQEIKRFALDLIRTENPMVKPEGEFIRGTYRISWKSESMTPPVAQVGYPQGIGKHEVGLYKTRISVFRATESVPWFTEEITTIGHQRSGNKAATPFR